MSPLMSLSLVMIKIVCSWSQTAYQLPYDYGQRGYPLAHIYKMEMIAGTTTTLSSGDSIVFDDPGIGTAVTIRMTYDWDSTEIAYCPSCIRQLYFGVDDGDAPNDCNSYGRTTATAHTLSMTYTSDGFVRNINLCVTMMWGCSDIVEWGCSYIIGYIDGLTRFPTMDPTKEPTSMPSSISSEPSDQPTAAPSELPSPEPSDQPTAAPSEIPSSEPSDQPTAAPSELPSPEPSDQPTAAPSEIPSSEPSDQPTAAPSEWPSSGPTDHPTIDPTSNPTPSDAVTTNYEISIDIQSCGDIMNDNTDGDSVTQTDCQVDESVIQQAVDAILVAVANVQIVSVNIVDDDLVIRLSVTTDESNVLQPHVIWQNIEREVTDNDHFGEVEVEEKDETFNDIKKNNDTPPINIKRLVMKLEDNPVIALAIFAGLMTANCLCCIGLIRFCRYNKKKAQHKLQVARLASMPSADTNTDTNTGANTTAHEVVAQQVLQMVPPQAPHVNTSTPGMMPTPAPLSAVADYEDDEDAEELYDEPGENQDEDEDDSGTDEDADELYQYDEHDVTTTGRSPE